MRATPAALIAAVFIMAGLASIPAFAEDGKLVIGAASVRNVMREYSDGRKETRCVVVFTLQNKTGKQLHRARFWVVAANGQREGFGLWDGKEKNTERFNKTDCKEVRGKLKLLRAVCSWRVGNVAGKREDCAGLVVLDVK